MIPDDPSDQTHEIEIDMRCIECMESERARLHRCKAIYDIDTGTWE